VTGCAGFIGSNLADRLLAVGQLAVPEEINDLFERGFFGEGVDVIAEIAEDAAVAVDETDFRRSSDYAFETCSCCGRHKLWFSLPL
jgi:nucleoside-diphosphate-sugar epimerase